MTRLSSSRTVLIQVVWSVAGAALTWGIARTTYESRHLRPSVEAAPFADLLTWLAAWLLLGCAVWSTSVGAAALVESASRGRLRATSWVGAPRVLRRLVLGGVGVALVATPTPALAAGPGHEPSRADPAPGLRVPARTLGGAVTPSAGVSDTVRVEAGDCLWHLARSRLPSSATGAEVAAAAAATYRLNRRLIGPDPDLIKPGQQLSLPLQIQHPRPEESR